jgi:beta-glucosidase
VDADACCTLCAGHPGCQAFSWDVYNQQGQKNGECYMKSACPSTTDSGAVTAGELFPGPPPAPSPGPGPAPGPFARPVLPVTAATKRAASIVAQMTTAEKASLLNGIKSAAYGDSHNGYYVGNIPGVARLKVPSLNMQDASQGFRTLDKTQFGQVTSWPCSLAVAANWDTEATRAWGVALGVEFRAKGANMILGPSLNVHRVARGGRNAEYISGEDGYLGSQLVPEYVTGVQSQRVIANIKHYALNNQETNRGTVDSLVGERALQEVYMAPFRAGARAGAASAMCSYNLLNGTYACGHAASINRNLKADYNWTGFVTSDWGAVHGDGYQHSGLDMDQPGTDHHFDPRKLTGDAATLDDMATRVVGALVQVDAFDHPVCTGGVDCSPFLYEANATSAAHAALARSLAANGAALLKNENATLPLGRPGSTIAVVGAACDAPYDLEGLAGKWNKGNYYVMGGSGRVLSLKFTSILDGIKARAKQAGATVTAEAAGADVVVTCGACWSTEGADRRDLLVDQDADIAALVRSAAAPVVVLLQGPGALVTSSFREGAASIVSMFLAGQATGLAWADVLFGDVNPAGRLPVTFPLSEADTTPPCPGTACEYSEGLAVGYRGMGGKAVAFPFGHGLSYTSFSYGPLAVTRRGAAGCAAPARVCVAVAVANAGQLAGAEVAQLYLTYPAAAGEPGSPLRGFRRTQVLAPGATASLTFQLTDEDVGVWDAGAHAFRVWTQGDFVVGVGGSSRALHSNATFAVHI